MESARNHRGVRAQPFVKQYFLLGLSAKKTQDWHRFRISSRKCASAAENTELYGKYPAKQEKNAGNNPEKT
jgi:hypothetical protein